MLEIIKNKDFNRISNIEYGFFTRKGGFSIGEFNSLNVNSSEINGEPKENVEKNLDLIKRYFNSPYSILKLKQIHSNKVYVFEDLGILPSHAQIEADSVVTKIKYLIIGISTADCVPILLSDEKNEIIAAIHAGWKSAITGIIENTVVEMVKIGADINEIKALIGPHLRLENFEVQKDFIKILRENNVDDSKFIVKKDNKLFFNITDFVKNTLKKQGIKYIYDVDLDTYTNPELFFSYRRSCHEKKDKYGCQFSTIMLKKPHIHH